jgi:23S rRNA (cytosine1962-C5)-methyltransferase
MLELTPLLDRAWTLRQAAPLALAPLRLFNGFREGLPDLAVDLYGGTLVIFAYTPDPARAARLAQEALAFYRLHLPALTCVVLKRRSGPAAEVLWGGPPDTQVTEAAVQYALDLSHHQDATLYLDTRQLRRWAAKNLSGQRVLNTFAYTGSLGIAALAGGASRVLQTDLNPAMLDLARRSAALNGWGGDRHELLHGDFFRVTAHLRHTRALFDCVILDPPFFSQTAAGSFDLNQDTARLVNKVRPLLADGGRLVAINNAVFVSGHAYLAALEELCAGGFLALETFIPVPDDFIGLDSLPLPADPAPFNHSTKIAVLHARRKDGRTA